jgi:hypothetical protein
MKKIEIQFNYKGHSYDAVIRIEKKTGGAEYHITVLDWKLERLLYGNHIIKESEGVLQANVSFEKKEQTELKLSIAGKLSSYLRMPCFSGDLCIGPAPIQESWEGWHPVPRHPAHQYF